MTALVQSLPLSEAADEETADPQPELRILLIEDEPVEARLVTRLLGLEDEHAPYAFRVNHVGTLAGGLAALVSEPIDLVLLDLGLPDSTGIDAIEQVHDKAPRIPVVVLTGDDDMARAMAAVRMGAQDYFVKQVLTRDGLMRCVLHAVERNQMQQQIAKQVEELLGTKASLERNNADLEHFAYIASHDLKSPLRGIDNLSEWIAEDLDASVVGGEVIKNLERLQLRVRRLERYVEDILVYSRAGRMDQLMESVELKELLLEVCEDLDVPDGFSLSLPDQMPTMETPRAPLQSVFFNLIGNTVKHHDRGEGCIEVAAQTNERGWLISVTDDGPGIAPEHHERIFEMFHTLAPKASNASGMGLAIVKRLVSSGGGELRVCSPLGARGTRFEFQWPRRQERVAATT